MSGNTNNVAEMLESRGVTVEQYTSSLLELLSFRNTGEYYSRVQQELVGVALLPQYWGVL